MRGEGGTAQTASWTLVQWCGAVPVGTLLDDPAARVVRGGRGRQAEEGRPGPFSLSTYQPIGDIAEEADMSRLDRGWRRLAAVIVGALALGGAFSLSMAQTLQAQEDTQQKPERERFTAFAVNMGTVRTPRGP